METRVMRRYGKNPDYDGKNHDYEITFDLINETVLNWEGVWEVDSEILTKLTNLDDIIKKIYLIFDIFMSLQKPPNNVHAIQHSEVFKKFCRDHGDDYIDETRCEYCLSIKKEKLISKIIGNIELDLPIVFIQVQKCCDHCDEYCNCTGKTGVSQREILKYSMDYKIYKTYGEIFDELFKKGVRLGEYCFRFDFVYLDSEILIKLNDSSQKVKFEELLPKHLISKNFCYLMFETVNWVD